MDLAGTMIYTEWIRTRKAVYKDDMCRVSLGLGDIAVCELIEAF